MHWLPAMRYYIRHGKRFEICWPLFKRGFSVNYPLQNKEVEIAVMFADVAGSTQLFDQIGDKAAKAAIDQCLTLMIEIIENNQGKIVKTIGDEVMCRFSKIDNAAISAVSIQNRIEEFSASNTSNLKVRIGMHYGPAILEKGDVFGDVVNVAARITGIAQKQQIITTEELASNISPVTGIMTRQFDRVKVKGKQEEMTVYEILWEQNEQTVMQSPVIQFSTKPTSLIINYQNIEKKLSHRMSCFSLGREAARDLFVNSPFASRAHAVIEYHRGKFVIHDHSLNGTYVKDESGQEIYLRREELPLTGRGTISLGAAIDNNPDHLIEYQYL